MREPSRFKKWFLPTITVLTSILLTISVLEISLWLIAPVPFHEWMEWIPDGRIQGRAKPLQEFQSGTDYGVRKTARADGTKAERHTVRINRLGFRGPEYEWRPAPGTLRIATFAGSSGFCYNQAEEETWPGRLQVYLEQGLNMPVEVINLALPGFNSANSKINYLFTGRELHPHVAIFYHTWNDIKWFRLIEQSPIKVIFASIASNKPYWERLARKTQIGRRVRNFLRAKQNVPYGETTYFSPEPGEVGADRPVSPAALLWARRNFSDFAMFAHSDNVLPVLVSQATIIAKENLTKPEYNKKSILQFVGMTPMVLFESWIEMNRIMKEVSSQSSTIFIDGYGAVPHNYIYLEDHVHLTTEGCAVLAQGIADALLKDRRFLKMANHLRLKP